MYVYDSILKSRLDTIYKLPACYLNVNLNVLFISLALNTK